MSPIANACGGSPQVLRSLIRREPPDQPVLDRSPLRLRPDQPQPDAPATYGVHGPTQQLGGLSRAEVAAFLKARGAKKVVSVPEIMGCPHEEGEDFPMGEDCPFCPFWTGKQGTARRDVLF